MRYVNVDLGFLVDREKLGQYIIKEAGDRKITPVIGGFIGMQFLVGIDSIDNMPVYKTRIEKNGSLIEKIVFRTKNLNKFLKNLVFNLVKL